MTNYDTGRRFEWATRDALRADGYDLLARLDAVRADA